MSSETPKRTPDLVKHGDLIRVDYARVYHNNLQRYETFDGREVVLSIGNLDYALGGQYKAASTEEKALFLTYCISNRLDPLSKQCYFIRYDQKGPPSFVVSWEVFLTRAQMSPDYDGLENGIVWRVKSKSGKWSTKYGSPCQFSEDADHQVAGGWARVFRKSINTGRHRVEVPLREMIGLKNGQPNRTWSRQLTTMAIKTPTARALRMAFPEDLGGLYTEGESEFHSEVTGPPQPQPGDPLPSNDLDDIVAKDPDATEPEANDEPIDAEFEVKTAPVDPTEPPPGWDDAQKPPPQSMFT